MNTLGPAIAKLLFQTATGEFKPDFVEKGVELVRARHPDQHGRGVRHRTEPRLAFAQHFHFFAPLFDKGGEK